MYQFPLNRVVPGLVAVLVLGVTVGSVRTATLQTVTATTGAVNGAWVDWQ